MKISLSNKYLRLLFLYLAFSCAVIISACRFFELSELQTYDWRCQIRGPRPVSDRIVVIEIDDKTIDACDWPLGREYFSRFINALNDAQAEAIVFDLIFRKPQPGDTDVLSSLLHAKHVYFSYKFADPILSRKKFISKFISDGYSIQNQTIFADKASGLGFANTQVDVDGKRRRTFPVIYYRGKLFLQLSFKVAADLLHIPEESIGYVSPGSLFFSKDLSIPLDDEGYFIVNYAARWNDPMGFKRCSFSDVFSVHESGTADEKKRMDSLLRGKICIVGLSGTGTYDRNSTPLEAVYPMVGQYANILNGILVKDFIRRLDRLSNALIVIIGMLLVGFVSSRLKPLKGFLAIVIILLSFTAGAVFIFNKWGLWIDLFYPVLVFAIVYMVSTLGRTMSEMRKRQLMEKELEIASQIQKSFLPDNPPAQEGLDLSVYIRPAKAVGGDLYVFVPMGDQMLGVMVGDVSGKGSPAALFMAKCVSEFKFIAHDNPDPADVLRKLNNKISSETSSGLLVTMIYAIFDPKNKKVIMANGGHLPMVIVSADGESNLLNVSEGIPIGVMAETPFTVFEQAVNPGDCFALYTDGVSEARNRRDEEYGVSALQDVIARHRQSSTADILKEAVADLNRFVGRAEQHDDTTLIVIKIT